MKKERNICCAFTLKVATLALFLILSLGEELSAQVKIKLNDSDEYALQANNNFNEGNWDEGKAILDAGLKEYPKDSDLKMLLGKYYHHYQALDRARYELVKSLEYNPNNVDAKQILINVETDAKRYSSAICYVNELLEVNPYSKGLWRKKIELYRLQGNTVEANRLLARINQIYPNDETFLRDYMYETELNAINLQKSGQIDQAISLRSELIKRDPKNLEFYIGIVNDYIKAGDTYNALAYIDRGLMHSPGNIDLILKKASLLEEQKRYSELLSFLQQHMNTNSSPRLREQYNYYLLEAARNAKDSDPAILYGKILERNPGNEEAFNYVYNSHVGNQQYEEALYVLNRYRDVKGESKDILLKEQFLYKKMGHTGRVSLLTKRLFALYPNDTDLQEEYVKLMYSEGKEKMQEEQYAAAIKDFQQVILYGDSFTVSHAQRYIYNASLALKDYSAALNVLNEIIIDDSDNPELYVQRADLYFKLNNYHNALAAYEHALTLVSEEDKARLLGGYGDMVIGIVKNLNEISRYDESLNYVRRWLAHDPNNRLALQYAVNLSLQTKQPGLMYAFAKQGNEMYPDELFFKIKLAEHESIAPEKLPGLYTSLHNELYYAPFHEGLIRAFSKVSDDYAEQLIKENMSEKSIAILDTALVYAPNDRTLKYRKGVAYEKLHVFDSAHYYQSFYEPSLLESSDFKNHLSYLKSKSYKNEAGVSILGSRHGHDYAINFIYSLEYKRFQSKKNTYTGRINYAGRDQGKGFQIQGEWEHLWNEKTYTRIDLAGANKYFPLVALNASIFHEFNFLGGIEGEAGLGYRYLPSDEHLSDIVFGATKELEKWRFNLRFFNYMLNYKQGKYNYTEEDGLTLLSTEPKTKWMFNISGSARYNISSPKHFVIATAGVGTAPDVDLINYKLYDKFSGVNTTVGAGYGRMISDTVSIDVLGTWYNYYQVDGFYGNLSKIYRNLYTITVNLHVVF